LFAEDWQKAYREVLPCCAPGLEIKRSELRFHFVTIESTAAFLRDGNLDFGRRDAEPERRRLPYQQRRDFD
jgi:hypothetical protein